MNRKYIIGILVAGAVIGIGYYLYSRNKNNDSKKKNDTIDNGSTTEKDALKVVDALHKSASTNNYAYGDILPRQNFKRDGNKLPLEKLNNFVKSYVENVDKKLHNKILATMNKEKSNWDSQDLLNMSELKQRIKVN